MFLPMEPTNQQLTKGEVLRMALGIIPCQTEPFLRSRRIEPFLRSRRIAGNGKQVFVY
jgi:hypothetical protein